MRPESEQPAGIAAVIRQHNGRDMFITVEGIEGSGKSTLIALLAERLEELGHACLVTREPGGCGLGDDLRRILLESERRLDDRAELFLFLADRAQHVTEVLRPALSRGEWVICDRYADSTVAYQGFGRGMDAAMLRSASDVAADGLSPDLTFLLDLPAEEGLRRARLRNLTEGTASSEGRFEAEELAFHERVRTGFLKLAEMEPSRFAVLDARCRPQELLAEALERLGISFPSQPKTC